MHRHAPLLYLCGLPALASLLLASMQACGGRVDLLDSVGDVPEIDASTNLGQPETLDASLPPSTADAGLDADAAEGADAGDASLVDANDGGLSLPAGTKGVTVNKTSASLGAEGFVLATQASAPNPAGAFNGAGTGNKAFLGFEALDGLPVTQLGTVTLRARRDVGSSLLYVNLQIDCDGDGAWNPAVDGIVVVDAGAAPGLALGATFADVTIQPTDAVFTVVGYAVALALAAYLLWFTGRLAGQPIGAAVAAIVVLGFPMSIGATAARAIL